MRQVARAFQFHLFLAIGALLPFAWTPGGLCAGQENRKLISFDRDWRFHLGDESDFEAPDFSDADWRTLDLPHDWSIEGAIDPQNPSGQGQAFLPMGIGWYRKTFDTPADLGQGNLWIEFDGVMQDSTVWLNGKKLGERPSGYVSFRYDLTAALKPQGKNVLAVRVDNSLQPSSRWYAGSGITRHVRLIETGPTRIQPWSTVVTTPTITPRAATVHIQTVEESLHAGRGTGPGAPEPDPVEIDILAPDGKLAAHTQLPGTSAAAPGMFSADIQIAHPRLWGIGGGDKSPLYHAIVRVMHQGTLSDQVDIPFGIRTAEFKPDTGFWLNGINLKIKGVCLHLDGGGVGAAVPMGVWERRLDALRSLGVNAVRTSHNPPDPAFLDLLDRKGFLVMHEIFDTWNTAKARGDYAHLFAGNWQRDLTDTLMRDRNHPCIIIYSAGNEIHDSPAAQLQLFPQIRDLYHRLDPTRPVTLAMLQADRPGGGFTNGLAQLQDVVGANYRPVQLSELQAQNPSWKIIETETNYGAPELPALFQYPQLSGEFLWTGVDYLGESMSPTGIAQGFGLLDRTGQIRARGYEHAQWWSETPMVKIARVIGPGSVNRRDVGGGRVCDWTPANTTTHQESIEVYSNCDEVELFLNGASLGKKQKPSTMTRTWQVPFAAGTIRAVARNQGQQAATDELTTAGPAAKLVLSADQKSLSTAWDDVAYVRVNIADAAGTTNPNASDQITFSLTGPGTIMAVDNADLDSDQSFRGNQRRAFRGTCIAIIKATGAGEITLNAAAPGLAPGSVTIHATSQ